MSAKLRTATVAFRDRGDRIPSKRLWPSEYPNLAGRRKQHRRLGLPCLSGDALLLEELGEDQHAGGHLQVQGKNQSIII